MHEPITYVGIDAHQRELQIAVLREDSDHIQLWTAPNETHSIERVRRRLERDAPGTIDCCYEAGPTGYGLQRQLDGGRIRCRVIAPSLMPRRPGDRIKTNRRDARQLVTLLRGGLLTDVRVPSPAAEAVRDLVRARDDARADLLRHRQRLSKLLLRRGLMYPAVPWTKRHREWLDRLEWPHPAERQVVGDYRLGIAQLEARLVEIDRAITEIATSDAYRAAAGGLRCFRGIDTVTAVTLVAELYDFRRFPHPRALMAFVGLVPSEHSTGSRRRMGGITKAGNRLVRRLLVQSAWHYRHAPRLTIAVRRRREGAPPAIIALADKAEQRLCRRYGRLCARLKPKPVVITAVARELVGFLWAALQLTEVPMP